MLGKPSVGTSKPTPIAPPAQIVYDFENVFDWRSGPRRGWSPPPRYRSNLRPDRAPLLAGGPRQELLPCPSQRSGLRPELLRAVQAQGYTDPTPVQREAIPLVLEGATCWPARRPAPARRPRSSCPYCTSRGDASARPCPSRRPPTPRSDPDPHAGARHPGRGQPCATYGATTAPLSTAIFGGVGFPGQVGRAPARPRDRGRHAGPAARPRPPAHHRPGAVEILVLDEADRMLDMGFIRDIRSILALLPDRRQNLLFSATFSNEIRWPGGGSARSARIGAGHAPQHADRAGPPGRLPAWTASRKRELLSHLVRTRAVDQALVFTRTKHGANKLAEQLWQDGIATAAIHGNKSQPQRTRALQRLQGRARDAADRDRGRRPRPRHRAAAARRQLRAADGAIRLRPPHRPHRSRRHRWATRSPWSASTSARCCATSSACWARRFPRRRWPALNRIAPFAPSRFGCAPPAETAEGGAAARRIAHASPSPASSRDASVRDARRPEPPLAMGPVVTATGRACPGERKRR